MRYRRLALPSQIFHFLGMPIHNSPPVFRKARIIDAGQLSLFISRKYLIAQLLHESRRSGNAEGMNVLVTEYSIACVNQQERTALLEVKVWQ